MTTRPHLDLLLGVCALAVSACASTRLEIPTNHPAHPEARAGAVPKTSALAASAAPQPEPAPAAPAHDHSSHGGAR